MCGILGGTCKEWDYKAAIHEIAHRGPDGERIEEYQDLTLGFVRLAIRDLSDKAMQPMASADGSVILVFNGELYAIDMLRAELEKEFAFNTTSDTEVLLNAYLKYDIEFVNHIDGMFACAIYDRRKDCVMLFRDRVGIKPLYYYYNGHDFAFFSELKAGLRLAGDISAEIDNTALYDYFSYSYIPEPKTCFKLVRKLQPAHMIVFHTRTHLLDAPVRYWELSVNPYEGEQLKRDEIVSTVRSKIEKSVSDQMVSDVPVGTLLSGGIDSSIVTVTASKYTDKLRAFSIGFDVDETTTIFDESLFAKILSDRNGIELTQKKFTVDELNCLKGKLSEWYDEPFSVISAYPSYFVCDLVSKSGIEVVLTGDGGDEIFGGYSRYVKFRELCSNRRINGKELSLWYYHNMFPRHSRIRKVLLGSLEEYGIMVDWTNQSQIREILSKRGIVVPKDYDDFWYFRQYDNPELPPITRAQYIDFMTYLPSQCLQKMDRVSMACSIETRVPMCAKDIIEYSFGLSEADRCPIGELKGTLKEAFRGIVPNEILDKEKKGFTYPPFYESNIPKRGYEYRNQILIDAMNRFKNYQQRYEH